MKDLIERIKRHEGFSPTVYRCPSGKQTIGYGRLIESPGGLSKNEAEILLHNDLHRIQRELYAHLPWMPQLSAIRQEVLLEMAYQLGVSGLLKFKKTLREAQRGSWQECALEMLDSRWARQTPGRAKELAEMMRTGDAYLPF
ncbi:MAG: glycoside hydrolase family protein [bacterium]